MTIYELIKELTYYPPNAEIFAEVGNSGLKFDVGGVEAEFLNRSFRNGDRVVVVLDPY